MKFDWSKEELQEHERIVKTYQRENLKLVNRRNKDIADKIWLQMEALRALGPYPDLLAATGKLFYT